MSPRQSYPTTDAPAQLLPSGYELQELLARTHFSSVWLASTTTTAGAQPPAGTTPDACCGLSSSVAPVFSGELDRFGTESFVNLVVVKAVEATRPTHAAVAANEAAALRYLSAACKGTSAVLTATGNDGNSSNSGSCTGSAGGPHPADAASADDLPFVQLLGTFTTDAMLTKAPATVLDYGVTGQPEAAGQLAPEQRAKGRWRCLVMERLGPTAADVLEASQQAQRRRWRRQVQQPQCGQGAQHQQYQHQKQEQQQTDWLHSAETDRGGRLAEARRQVGWGPRAVKCFAVHALAALDLMHRCTRLVHCDIKPDNFALRQHPSKRVAEPRQSLSRPLPLCTDTSNSPVAALRPDPSNQHGHCDQRHGKLPGAGAGLQDADGERKQKQRRQGGGEWYHRLVHTPRWALLDFGSACSLEPGGQRVADGPAGHGAVGHVRPCAALRVGTDSDDDGGANAWYDTPSYTAPELTLGLPPSPASDMWSLGCTLYELATGNKLLPLPPQLLRPSAAPTGGRGAALSASSGPDVTEVHLALVTRLLGPPPRGLLNRAPRAEWFFDIPRRRLLLEDEYEMPATRSLAQRLVVAPPSRLLAAAASYRTGSPAVTTAVTSTGVRQVALPAAWAGHGGGGQAGGDARWAAAGCCRGQGEGIHDRMGPEVVVGSAASDDGEWDEAEWAGLYRFLTPMLQWDPRNRPSAFEAARHPWLAAL